MMVSDGKELDARRAHEESATAHALSLPPESRRDAGVVYTPNHLVEFVLEQAGYNEAAPIDGLTLLDPACGAGVFLVAAIDRLAARLRKQGVDLGTTAGRRALATTVEANLHGIDVDEVACALAVSAVGAAVRRHAPGPLPRGFFEGNVVRGDFLIDHTVDQLPVTRRGGLGLVVGNPPYVPATRLEETYKRDIRARFSTARGRLDLYTLFIERAVSLLAERGRFAFVTPDKYLTSETSRPLRAHLLHKGVVQSLATFTSHRVFDDAATVPCVTVFERGGTPTDVVVLECGERPNVDGQVAILRRSTVPSARLTAQGWAVSSPGARELARQLQHGHPLVAQCVSRISAGLASGRDGIYVIPEELAEDLEPELLHQAVRGRDVGSFNIEQSRLLLLVPYTFDRNDEAHLIDIEKFPRARAYLQKYRRELEARHCVKTWSKRWYDVHDPVMFNVAARPKVLVPDVASTNRFAFDEGQRWPLHSAYYLLPSGVDPLYLTAVLNSMPLEFLIRLLAPTVKDGFSRYRKQFLMQLPVPTATPKLRAEIVKMADSRDREGLDELVIRLFALPKSAVAGMRRFLAERALLARRGAETSGDDGDAP